MTAEERQVAEALGPTRDARLKAVRARAERRERIATQLMAGAYANTHTGLGKAEDLALAAMVGAFAAILEHDRSRP